MGNDVSKIAAKLVLDEAKKLMEHAEHGTPESFHRQINLVRLTLDRAAERSDNPYRYDVYGTDSAQEAARAR